MDAEALPLDAAFALHLHTGAHGDRRQGALLLVAVEAAASASGGLLRVHRIEAVAAAPPAAADGEETLHSSRRAWLELESVEAVVAAATPTRLARSTWVAVPCAHLARFLRIRADASSRTGEGDGRGRCLLWNPATDALLLPRLGPGDDRPSSVEAVGVAPAAAAVAAMAAVGGGGWEWRRASSNGEADWGRLVWREEGGAALHLVLVAEEGGTGGCGSAWWRLQQQEQQEEQLATELVYRRREWMGHDHRHQQAADVSPPFKLVNAASLRALCTCSGGSGLRVCRRHLSDDCKWAYHAPTQAIVETTTNRRLHVRCAEGGAGKGGGKETLLAEMEMPDPAATESATLAVLRWVYDPASALLLFPAALAALAADAEGRWEAPLPLLSPVPGAAEAAAAVQRLRWYPERHALPLPACLLLPFSPSTTTSTGHLLLHHHHQQQQQQHQQHHQNHHQHHQRQPRAATLSRAAVAGLGLLRPSPTEADEEGMRLLAEGGEAQLYATCGPAPDAWVRKAHHRHAAGKALKELQALLAAGAHAADDDHLPPSSPSLPVVGLRGVEWPLDSARPTALLLERASGDLRSLLLNSGGQENEEQLPPPHGQQQQQQQPRKALPIAQVLNLALGLALAAARLHASGLCHRDIHSGNVLIRRCALELEVGDVALADLGLASAWTPLRAALDMRAIALVLLEASWDGARRGHRGGDGVVNDNDSSPEPWPPSRITAKSCLDHDDPRFLALSDLPPNHVDVLRPLLLGCFGVGNTEPNQQLTPRGLAAAARRRLLVLGQSGQH